jgi:DNA-binding transcriptional MerR regulator
VGRLRRHPVLGRVDSDSVAVYNGSMSEPARDLSIEELADAAGVPVRTVRFYISDGLLPGPGGRGRAAFYGEEHQLRLQLIRVLAARRVPLAEIRERLAGLTLAEIRALLAEEETTARQQAAEQSPRDYISVLLARARELRKPSEVAMRPPAPPVGESWRRWVLAPGVELHVRLDAAGAQRTVVERILRAAGLDLNAVDR